MQEAGVLLGPNNSVIKWHIPEDRSGGAIPDKRNSFESLWYTVLKNIDKVTGFAHTHPGRGTPGPSYEDIGTFIAHEKALGKHLNWFILSEDSQVICLFDNEIGEPHSGIITVEFSTSNAVNMTWMNELRRLSQY